MHLFGENATSLYLYGPAPANSVLLFFCIVLNRRSCLFRYIYCCTAEYTVSLRRRGILRPPQPRGFSISQ